MKKRGINSLKLNKRSISSLKEIVKGGLVPYDNGSNCTSLGNGDPCPKSQDCEAREQ